MSGLEEASREELLALVVAQAATIESLTRRVAEWERQVKADSSNSFRPPSSDAPWEKKPAKKRSSRTRSGASRRCEGCGRVNEPRATDVPREIVSFPGGRRCCGEPARLCWAPVVVVAA